MIEFRDVVKTFPQHYGVINWIKRRGVMPRRRAIDHLSFKVERGELFGLLGANGSGKSTILRMLAGLISPDAGAIRVADVDVVADPVRARSHIGLSTGDERSFFHRLTARHNLELYAGMCGVPRARRAASIERAIRAVDLQGDLDRRFDSFSSGMRQRLAIARAMLTDPDVLLLDEPTRAVDPVHAEQLRTTIYDLVHRHGKTVVLTTNLLDEAWYLCGRVAVLNAGAAIAVGRGEDLRERAAGRRHYAISVDRIDEELLARLRAVTGVTHVDQFGGEHEQPQLRLALDPRVRSLNELLAAMSSNGVAVTAIGPLSVSAAELFGNLTSGASDGG
jgi:ABC-2 type transport system ATP-binding protein